MDAHRILGGSTAVALAIIVSAAPALATGAPAAAATPYTAVQSFGTGLLGDGTSGTRTSPAKIAGLGGHLVTQISSYSSYGPGGGHTLALTSNGSMYSWGDNEHGELGNGTTTASLAPSTPLRLGAGVTGRVVAVAAGYQFSLALTSTGQVLTWGAKAELGDGSTTDRSTPKPIPAPGGQAVTAIAAGEANAEVVTASGQVWGWGNNASGELGDGTLVDRSMPVRAQLPAGFVATAVATGGVQYAAEPQPFGHTLALGANGSVYAWGANQWGELGTKQTSTDQPVPVATAIPKGATVVAIAAGGENSAAIDSTGRLLTWGLNSYGTLGDSTNFQDAHPSYVTTLPAGQSVAQVSMSYYTTLVRTTSNAVYGWGDNATFDRGALATDSVKHTATPIAITLPSGQLTMLDAGGPTSYAIVQN
jgi:alpha-tubulin suppressor-like RCC1 family protein